MNSFSCVKKIKPHATLNNNITPISKIIFSESRLALSVAFAITSLLSSNALAAVTYTGTGVLEDSDSVGSSSQFSELIGGSKAGVFENLASNSEITINYATGNAPFFVLSGYVQATLDGNAETLSSLDNTVNLVQGKIDGNVYAGLAHGIQITENIDCTTTSSGCTQTSISNYGGGKTLSSDQNKITVSGNNVVTANGDLYAGYTGLTIKTGDINAANPNPNPSVQTFASNNTLSATGNRVVIEGDSHTFENITAGYAGLTLTTGDLNAANATADASVLVNAYADHSTLSATGNSVAIEGGSHTFENITAGYAGLTITTGDLNAATAANSTAYAATSVNSSKLSATGNSVAIDGNSHTFENITAGYAGLTINTGDLNAGTADTNTGAGANSTVETYGSSLSAIGNSISITGQDNTVNDLIAGYAGINIGYGNIKGGTSVTNGSSAFGSGSLGIDVRNTTLSASGNAITLNGSSTVNGDIHTGYIDFNIDHGTVKNGGPADTALEGTVTFNAEGTSAKANNNVITISGEHTFTKSDASIYGGYLNYSAVSEYKPETYDVFTGNTLNYANKTPITIGSVANFQNFNFTVNPALVNTGTALITAKNIVLGSDASNVSDGSVLASDIKVVSIHSGAVLPTDSKFVLMQAAPGNLVGLGQGYLSKGVAQQGISLLYDVETSIDKANDQVIAVIAPEASDTGPRVNPRVKALLEGQLSGLMLLTRGADALSNTLFTGINEQNNKQGLEPFLITSGNHSRYDSGSHIKSNGALMAAGLSFQDEQLTGAVFFETGRDSYKTNNDFDDALTVKGQGHNRFSGIGAFVHYDFDNRWYADGMLRGGRLHTNFDSNDLANASTGEQAKYKIHTTYLGATATGGYVLPLNEQNDVDLSAKYLWTGVKGKKETVAGDPINFKDVSSQRVRLNAENHYKMTPEVTLLAGLGYEYEFDGKAKGTTYERFNIDEPSVKGSTGIGTVGMRYVPSSNDSFSMDVKGSGYFGKREGASLTVQLGYEF